MNKPLYLAKRVAALYKVVDPLLEKQSSAYNTTCRRGCSHCCHSIVFTVFPDALAIASRLLERPDSDAIFEQLRSQLAYIDDYHPCVFLSNNECTIYSFRPFACRAHYVTNEPSICGDPSSTEPLQVIDMTPIDIFMLKSIEQASAQVGIKCYLAPLQVSVLWAVRLIREGRQAFEEAVATTHDATGLTYWEERLASGGV